MKDWTGNQQAAYATNGASNHSDKKREEHDYYATDPNAIDYLLEKISPDKNIWECACGEGHLSKRLIERGYNVKSTDLINRGFSWGGYRLPSDKRYVGWGYSYKPTLQICTGVC